MCKGDRVVTPKGLENDNELLVIALEHAREVASRHTDACGTDHANLARWLEELCEIRTRAEARSARPVQMKREAAQPAVPAPRYDAVFFEGQPQELIEMGEVVGKRTNKEKYYDDPEPLGHVEHDRESLPACEIAQLAVAVLRRHDLVSDAELFEKRFSSISASGADTVRLGCAILAAKYRLFQHVHPRVDYMLRALAKGHKESRLQAMKRLKVPKKEGWGTT